MASRHLSGGDERRAARRSLLVPWLVAGAFFMEMLDGTIAATALPAIARSFGTTPQNANIGNTAYLVAVAIFIPVSGWIADRFEARRVFAAAIALFTLSSVLCGLAPELWSFTAARALQGAAGAAMVPVGRLIVLQTSPKSDLLRVFNTIIWPGLIAPVIGPPLGGVIVTWFSWHWIFFMNVPLGIAGLILALRVIPRIEAQTPARALDLRGFLLVGAALGLIIYGIDTLGSGEGAVPVSAGAVILGLVLGALALRHLIRHKAPLLDLDLLGIPTFAVAMAGGTLLRVSMGAVPLLLPLFFQLILGLSPVAAGTLLLFIFAGNLAMKPFTTPVLQRFGFRSVMLVNGALSVAALVAFALFGVATPLPLIAAILFLAGTFRAIQFTSLATLQFADVPQPKMTAANTLASVMLQLSLGLGNVAGAFMLNVSAHARDAAAIAAADFRYAFLALAVFSLLGLWDTFKLDRTAGNALRGRQ
jgi:EmrB/QacA subfamily drug resistance transporter